MTIHDMVAHMILTRSPDLFVLVAEFWNPALVREPEVVALDAIERACMRVVLEMPTIQDLDSSPDRTSETSRRAAQMLTS